MLSFKLVLSTILFVFSCNVYSNNTILVDENNGLFSVISERGESQVIKAHYVAWGENWKWTPINVKKSVSKNKQSSAFQGRVSGLGIKFESNISKVEDAFVWNYKWNSYQLHPKAIGLGIEFNIEDLGGGAFKSPVLLPNNEGWKVQNKDGSTLTMKFEPSLAEVYFEQGNKQRIRAMFKTVNNSELSETKMTVSTSTELNLQTFSQYIQDGRAGWNENILPLKRSPTDLSYLNENHIPAGIHGRVLSEGDKLVFSDGTPASFWGTNIQGRAIFDTSDVNIKLHAKRISQLGFNLVRFHHHDSQWVQPNIFKADSSELSLTSLKKLDWWIKCLKDEGVYVWLDLHVGRTFKVSDNIDHFDDMHTSDDNVKSEGFNYLNKSIQRKMQLFNEQYLGHQNIYTNYQYVDDPAIIALQITNENDITEHFGHKFYTTNKHPIHNDLLRKAADDFSKKSNFELSNVLKWSKPEAKIFRNDLEHLFNEEMTAHLKRLGAKQLISTTNSWGGIMGLSSLPALSDGDMVDVHTYGGKNEFFRDPSMRPTFLDAISMSHLINKPLSISEWNIDKFPIDERFIAPLFVSSISRLQGWDIVMLYGYGQEPLNSPSIASSWSSYNDPSILGVMPAAALVFREGHVAEAKKDYVLNLTEKEFLRKKYTAKNLRAIRTLTEQSKIVVQLPRISALPWLNHNKSLVDKYITVKDPNYNFLSEDASYIESDTKELKRDWKKGIHLINTKKTQAASGRIGNQHIQLEDISIHIDNKSAVLSVQSLDSQAIRKSKKIYITALSTSLPSDSVKKLPYLSEPISGYIEIHAPEGLTLMKLDKLGREINTDIEYNDGVYKINFSEMKNGYWLTLHQQNIKDI